MAVYILFSQALRYFLNFTNHIAILMYTMTDNVGINSSHSVHKYQLLISIMTCFHAVAIAMHQLSVIKVLHFNEIELDQFNLNKQVQGIVQTTL